MMDSITDIFSLTPVERMYAQLDEEALGIVWAVEYFHLYLLDLHFEIITDHKPLVHAYKPTGRPPARVERFALRLQPYSFDILHIDGKSNVADCLNRLPLDCGEDISYRIMKEYVRSTVIAAVPPAMTPCDIERESEEDKELVKAGQSWELTSGQVSVWGSMAWNMNCRAWTVDSAWYSDCVPREYASSSSDYRPRRTSGYDQDESETMRVHVVAWYGLQCQ